MKRMMELVLTLAIVGLGFSSTLLYRAVADSPATGADHAGALFGYPACAYGAFLFLVIAVATATGLLVGSPQAGSVAETDPEVSRRSHRVTVEGDSVRAGQRIDQ